MHPNCCKFEFPLQLLASQDVYTKELTDARKQIDELKAQLRDAEFRAESAKLAASGGGAGHAQPSLPETPLANELEERLRQASSSLRQRPHQAPHQLCLQEWLGIQNQMFFNSVKLRFWFRSLGPHVVPLWRLRQSFGDMVTRHSRQQLPQGVVFAWRQVLRCCEVFSE